MSFCVDMAQYAGTIETYDADPVESGKVLRPGHKDLIRGLTPQVKTLLGQ